MTTTIRTTQDIIDICNKSTYAQRDGKTNYYYVYIHYTTKLIPFYIGQGSHNRAYKYKGRSKSWYDYVGNNIPIIKIVEYGLSFQESLNLENRLIKQYNTTLINTEYGHSPNESFSVLCFTKKGILVKRYESCRSAEIDGFNRDCISAVCNLNQSRYTYKNYIWCYEKDYENIKNTLFIIAPNCRKPVEVIFPDGTIKVYDTLTDTKRDGLLPAKVGAVLNGKRKSHKNCSFRYL